MATHGEGQNSLKIRVSDFCNDIWGVENEDILRIYGVIKAVSQERRIHLENQNQSFSQVRTEELSATTSPRDIGQLNRELQDLTLHEQEYILANLQLIIQERTPQQEEVKDSSSSFSAGQEQKPNLNHTSKNEGRSMHDLIAQKDHLVDDRSSRLPAGQVQTKTDLNRSFGRLSKSQSVDSEAVLHCQEKLQSLKSFNSPHDIDCFQVEKLKQQIDELQRMLQEKATELKHCQQRLSVYQQSHDKLRDTQSAVREQQDKIAGLELEKEDLLRRLSSIAGAKLSDNNPNITDLSDMNRPQKIGDKYSELYDNEWTNAFEVLTEKVYKKDQQRCIIELLNILEGCFEFCNNISSKNLLLFLNAALNPCYTAQLEDKAKKQEVERGKCPPQVAQRIIELKKMTAATAIPHVIQKFFEKLKPSPMTKDPMVHEYAEKCLEIGWYASIQDPPLQLFSEFKTNSPFDSNMTRNFTKSGKLVEYVVWPALLLHGNGPLLSKGVVQCTNVDVKKSDGASKMRRNSQDHGFV